MEGNNHLPLQEEIQCDIDTREHIEHSQSTLISLKKKKKHKEKEPIRKIRNVIDYEHL